jgi:pyruvate kinase
MDYSVIATLGPGSQSEAAWQSMLDCGADAFRLNTSHLNVDELDAWLERLEAFFDHRGAPVSVTLDLQGSKWRLGEFPAFQAASGLTLSLVLAPSTDQPNTLPIPHPDFFRAGQISSGEVVLNDARVRLEIEQLDADFARARVTQPGELAPRKGVTLAASLFRVETLPEKDQSIVRQTRRLPFVRYALSYVKDSHEMARFRQALGADLHLAAKLERQTALHEAALIAQSADQLWLCRGDLGAEMGMAGMAQAVHEFGSQVRALPVPVLIAGQVLEYMTRNLTPTRAEVCNLYDCLALGYRGAVLSDETALGQYPAEACRAAALFRQLR